MPFGRNITHLCSSWSQDVHAACLLSQACSKLPTDLSASCSQLVDGYADLLVSVIKDLEPGMCLCVCFCDEKGEGGAVVDEYSSCDF